jgi:hypothetical protein
MILGEWRSVKRKSTADDADISPMATDKAFSIRGHPRNMRVHPRVVVRGMLESSVLCLKAYPTSCKKY